MSSRQPAVLIGAFRDAVVATFVAGLIVVGGGCAGKLHAPGPAETALAQGRWPGTTLADLEQGRRLYATKCSSCHALYQPRDYEPHQWRGFVDEMVERAKLAPDDANSVVRYLVTASEATRSGVSGPALSGPSPMTH